MAATDRGSTRRAYRDALLELMTMDERVLCLDTDSGLFAGADFGAAAERYINLGIAEHTMMGMAAGLAADGWTPFVNTMAAFAATRAVEAVKLDIACPALPVRIAATHGGLSAGHFGPSHHALEDLAVMRAFPGLTVLVPADAGQTAALLDQTRDLPGPMYLRLDRQASPRLDADPPVLGRLQCLRHGDEVVIVAAGPHPVAAALLAAAQLDSDGVSAGVLNAHTLKPFDGETLFAMAGPVRLVATVEEHWRAGGLGGAVAEVLAERTPRRLIRFGVPDTYATVAGDHEYLLHRYGLDGAALAKAILDQLDAADRDTGPRTDPQHCRRT